jgi:hypothetical protein
LSFSDVAAGQPVGYKGAEYMQYRHIVLYIDGDQATLANLRAIITVGFTKDHKIAHNEGTFSPSEVGAVIASRVADSSTSNFGTQTVASAL